MSLTPKQQRFVEEYLVDLNATQAAIRAGYSEKTAHSQGPRLLENVEISKAVAAAFASRSERVQVTQDWVISRLVDNVERAMTAEPVRDREGNETGVYVYNGSVANKALELLGKHMGMFTDKHELTGKDGGPIETRDATFDEMSTEELAKLAVRLADGDGDEG